MNESESTYQKIYETILQIPYGKIAKYQAILALTMRKQG